MKHLLFTLLLTGLLTTVLQAQYNASSTDQVRGLLKSETFQLGVLIKTKAVFSLEDDKFNGGRKFDMGPSRIDIRGNLEGGFRYQFQVDVRQQTSLLDAQIGYRINDEVQIVAGAFKPFTSIDLDPNPGKIDFMSRARHVDTMMNIREIGVTLLGDHGALNYRIGLYNGTGLTRSNDNKFMFSFRGGYTAEFEENGKLHAGVNVSVNQTQGVKVGNSGLTTAGDRLMYGVYADYRGAKLIATAEVLQTTFDAVELGNQEEMILGFFGTLGYKLNKKNVIVARWDQMEYDIRNNSSALITMGWNHYATSLIKVSVNVLTQLNDGADNSSGVGVQIQYMF
jgi:hypothetical protein